MPELIYATKDNAEGTLSAGISAAATSIVLQSGEGAEFPQPYTGTASSLGSATTLNDTGDLANLAVGDFIRNVTDGSWAFVTVAGTNSVSTTRLRGGSDNTWESGDEWQVNEFIVTLEKRNAAAPPAVTQREKVLIKNRSTDTLAVRTRGYDSSVAAAFDANDYVNLHVVSAHLEHLVDAVYDLAAQINTNQTGIATNGADIDAIESNATFYVAAAGSSSAFTGTLASMPAAYTTGERLYFKANHDISGSATFNRAGLGAKTIKKVTTAGKVNLESGDIQDTGIYEVVYDGTDYVLQNPVANVPVSKYTLLYAPTADSDDQTSGSLTAFNQSYSLIANSLAVGDVIDIVTSYEQNNAVCTNDLRVGGTAIATTGSVNGSMIIHATLTVRAIGASGSLEYASQIATTSTLSQSLGTLTLDTTAGITVDARGRKDSGAGTTNHITQFKISKSTA